MATTATPTRSRHAEVVLVVFGIYSVILGLFMLVFATAHWAPHSVSHLVDTNHAAGGWVGWLEAVGLVFTTVLLAIALRASVFHGKREDT